MEQRSFCQSCMMPLDDPKNCGTEKDGSRSRDYCRFCYQDGAFTDTMDMEQMIAFCAPFEVKSGLYPTEEVAREGMRKIFPGLKRWAAKRAD